VNARRGFLRRIREEFAWNRDLRMPEAVFDFYAETQQEFQNVAQGGHPTTPVGRVFEDARDRGVDLTPEMVGGGRQKGSVRNMLLHPRTWVEKLQYAKNEGVTQTLLSGTPTPLEEPRHLTKAEKEEFDLIMNALEDQDLQADLSTKPLGIRVELLQQVLGILGVNVEELLNSLDNQ